MRSPENSSVSETHRGDNVNLTTEEARQGETSGHVRAVLAVSLSTALIALILIYLIFFG